LLETKIYLASSPRVDFKQQTIGLKRRKVRILLTTTNRKETTPLWINFTNTTKTRRRNRSLSDLSQQVQTREFKSRNTPTSVNALLSQCKSWITPQNRRIASRVSCSKTAQPTKKCTRHDLNSSHYSRTSFQHQTALT